MSPAVQDLNSAKPDRQVVVVFAKLPRSGKVKTRLAAGSNNELAVNFYKICAEHVIRQACSCTQASCIVAYSPVQDIGAVAEWITPLGQDIQLTSQAEEADLGQRMHCALAACLRHGASKALLVGSDIPDISKTVLDEAFAALDNAEMVLGPAVDGGFYLIGATRLPATVLQGIEWSTSTVLQETKQHAQRDGLSVSTALPTLQDIDTVQDLQQWTLATDMSHPLHKPIVGLMSALEPS